MRGSRVLSFTLPISILALAPELGCNRTAECETFEGCGVADTGDSGDGDGEVIWELPLTDNRDVDILFVIDNSGSMGEEQAILAASIGPFIDLLESEGVDANYRIGVTTTDNGNPWCPAGTTTPEGGKLVMSPCTTRLGDFLFSDIADVQDLACNDLCQLSPAELEILPTTTDFDGTPKPRPWLERIGGKKNIPEATSAAAAFACYAPQGVNGCGFESPLESMYLALTRMATSSEASYGFMRQSATLAVVILTDEADCSYNKEYAEIFETDGNKVFWADPTASFPTSAVCWNAGVECVGDPSGYDSCESVNKGTNGASNVSDVDAVLQPMSRYIGLVQGLEDQKQELNAQQEVIVALIGGVGSDGTAFYADVDNTDPAFQNSFGIGPGCVGQNPFDPNTPVTAVPPVRLREFTDAFTPGNMFSICETDYSAALEAIAQSVKSQIEPACYTKCVADQDPGTELVDPQCTLIQEVAWTGTNSFELVECLRDASGYTIDPDTGDYTMPSPDVNVCFAYLTDPGGLSSDPHDDMSPECADYSYNLEFKIARRPGFPAAGGTSISADCELAEFPATSCPGIGG